MDLAGIGAISAAAVALVGIPAAIAVGRMQLKAGLRTAEATWHAALVQADASYRAAMDTVRATASANQDQWRRGVRRDAFVRFLTISSELQHVELPEDPEVTEEEIRNAEKALRQIVDQAETAYHIVCLESANLQDTATRLLHAIRHYARGYWRLAATERAINTLSAIEEENRIHFDEVHAALGALATAGNAIDEVGHYRDVERAHNRARAVLCRVPGLSERHQRVILSANRHGLPNNRAQRRELQESRQAFLAAAQADLNAPAAGHFPGSYSLASPDDGQLTSTPSRHQPQSGVPSRDGAG
ncbi:hypothetical protein JK359_16570 [Streptomyces actinomycinicus]|uniref:Uncharacterized protein n=1 Tax=Streptomyces actinomycinicus TaxID=1695166 RepID=A0A937EK23_9ACTN|nr:hypothetical protein [Streptomyces actinomycinicus]MBL1083566.1 hypothetical protein [Streptomyces actinomycinicus]